jgi:3-phosphoshikimate 1-carboxyvinyltransferase
MDWKITPAQSLSGEVTAPADKSITHRAIIFAALAEGESVIENYLASEDCMHTLGAFEAMGVKAERTPAVLKITGVGLHGLKAPAHDIDAGNSGTTVRLMSGILAAQDFTTRIFGDASLSRRPMQRIMEPLAKMGAEITAEHGHLPLEIRGNPKLKPLKYLSAIASAQVKSCLLLAGLYADGISSFEEPIKSRDHTERMLKAAGVEVLIEGYMVAVKGPAKLAPQKLQVPGDISSAAFFLVAGAIARSGKLVVKNVGVNPTRDGILEVLRKMKAKITVLAQHEVSGEPVADIAVESSELSATGIGGAIMPRLIDEVPVLVLAATQAKGTTVISGAAELRVKESDRLKTIAAELNKMGAHIEEQKDGLRVYGPTPLHGADTESYGDHRIAMTLAVAGLIADGTTHIRNTECVDTSFPGFLTILEGLRK